MQKLAFYTTTTSRFSQRTLKRRVQAGLDIVHLADSLKDVEIEIIPTTLVPEVKNGRVTWDWFQKNITDALSDEYIGAFFHVTRKEGKRLGIKSNLNGSHSNDKDRIAEMWIQSDLNTRIKFKNGTSRYMLPKVIAHELGHHFKWTGRTNLEIHDYDYWNDINNIEQFYRDFDMKKEDVLVVKKVLPSQFFSRITQPFLNPSKDYKTGYHIGVDFGCPTGTPVYAPVDGELYVTKNLHFAGKTIFFLTKINGMKVGMRFCHLSKALRKGSYKAGDVIGYTGNTGALTYGPHLHWDMWKTWSITNTLGLLKGRDDIEIYMSDPMSLYNKNAPVIKKVSDAEAKLEAIKKIICQ